MVSRNSYGKYMVNIVGAVFVLQFLMAIFIFSSMYTVEYIWAAVEQRAINTVILEADIVVPMLSMMIGLSIVTNIWNVRWLLRDDQVGFEEWQDESRGKKADISEKHQILSEKSPKDIRTMLTESISSVVFSFLLIISSFLLYYQRLVKTFPVLRGVFSNILGSELPIAGSIGLVLYSEPVKHLVLIVMSILFTRTTVQESIQKKKYSDENLIPFYYILYFLGFYITFLLFGFYLMLFIVGLLIIAALALIATPFAIIAIILTLIEVNLGIIGIVPVCCLLYVIMHTVFQGTSQYLDRKFAVMGHIDLLKIIFTPKVEDDTVDTDQCKICRSGFDPNDSIRVCKKCWSSFHEDHLKTWVLNRSVCPVCKNRIEFSQTRSEIKPAHTKKHIQKIPKW